MLGIKVAGPRGGPAFRTPRVRMRCSNERQTDIVERRCLSTTCLHLADKVLRILRASPSWRCFMAPFSELVAVAFFLALAFRGLDAHLLVVLLQRRQVLASLGELTLLHALAHVPVHERAL